MPDRHGRHGRLGRSSVVRPPLPPLENRYERFDVAVTAAAEFLRAAWPDLRDVHFEVADAPAHTSDAGVPRWLVDRNDKRIVMYRIPIERLIKVPHVDDRVVRVSIEGAVFRAAAEYLGRDLWELGLGYFRF